jgi:hypothetical protein
MTDLRTIDGINAIILLMVIWIFIRVIGNDATTIIMADFISTRGDDGLQHGDLNKVGQIVGIVVAAMSVLMYADSINVEPTGLAALLGVALAYLGAVTMYASFLKSKRGTVETTRVTEPVTAPAKVTETKTQTP